MWKKLTVFGMMGALAYVLHVVLGGLLWKGYNHLIQPISDLTATGAPDKVLLTHITDIYAIFSIIFALSAFIFIRKFGSKSLKAGFILFLCMHLVSASYKFFPEDLPGHTTFTGFMHFVVTGAVVPLAILSPLVVGIGFRGMKEFKCYSVYSVITSIVIFVAGGISVALLANKLPYFGLFERINIGSLQLWMFLISLKLFTMDKNIGHTDIIDIES